MIPLPRIQPGFTLIELLVVLLIIATLASVAPPFLATAMPGIKVQAATRQLAANLRQARQQAIARRQEVNLSLDLNARVYGLNGESERFHLPEELTLTLTTSNRETNDTEHGQIRFYPDGSSSGGRIEIASANGTHLGRVDVDWLTGKVSVGEWNKVESP